MLKNESLFPCLDPLKETEEPIHDPTLGDITELRNTCIRLIKSGLTDEQINHLLSWKLIFESFETPAMSHRGQFEYEAKIRDLKVQLASHDNIHLSLALTSLDKSSFTFNQPNNYLDNISPKKFIEKAENSFTNNEKSSNKRDQLIRDAAEAACSHFKSDLDEDTALKKAKQYIDKNYGHLSKPGLENEERTILRKTIKAII